MSKKTTIEDSGHLMHAFSFASDRDPILKWQDKDGLLCLHLDGHDYEFRPSYILKPTVRHLETLAGFEPGSSHVPDLLVTVRLTDRMLDWCKSHRLSAMDLNGRAWLRSSGLLIDRGPLPDRNYWPESGITEIFAGKSERIVRTLLTDVEKSWRQAELVLRTGASSGLVSRVIGHLADQGYVRETTNKVYTIGALSDLLGSWGSRSRLVSRVRIHRYSSLSSSDPLHDAKRLRESCRGSRRIAFTQWLAGWLRTPYTEPVITTAYADRPLEFSAMENLGLREVTAGGNLWLYVPADEGVFLETQEIHGLPLVTDAQIYIDLRDTGLRGPDQANALAHLDNFCRPTR